MRILLVGEYSRLHNSLKEGLIKLGHEVHIIGTGDHFKKYPVDYQLIPKYKSGFAKKIKVGIYKIFKKDVTSINVLQQFFSFKDQLKNYDLVQLINESPLGMAPQEEKKALLFLKKYHPNIFLLSCGTDYPSVSYALEGKIRKSIFTPMLNKAVDKKFYAPALKYISPEFKELHHFLYKKIIKKVAASDLDYHFPLQNHPQYYGLIPNPINVDQLQVNFQPVKDKIVLFLGINRNNYHQKGIVYFEKALEQIHIKYPNRVEIVKVENLAYQEYIQQYNRAHILLDQTWGFDQGYNALEAMAQGKVVFTGGGKEFLEYYQIHEDEVCIDAVPDVEYLVEKISFFIENPQKIKEIGKNARAFIEKHHHYTAVAKKYLQFWESEK